MQPLPDRSFLNPKYGFRKYPESIKKVVFVRKSRKVSRIGLVQDYFRGFCNKLFWGFNSLNCIFSVYLYMLWDVKLVAICRISFEEIYLKLNFAYLWQTSKITGITSRANCRLETLTIYMRNSLISSVSSISFSKTLTSIVHFSNSLSFNKATN